MVAFSQEVRAGEVWLVSTTSSVLRKVILRPVDVTPWESAF